MVARVTAPNLATDVAGGERLLARHRDLRAEIQAKDDDFRTLYADGNYHLTTATTNLSPPPSLPCRSLVLISSIIHVTFLITFRLSIA